MRQGFVVVEGFYLAAVTGDIACILKMGFFFWWRMELFEKDKKSRVMHRLLQYSVHVGVEVAVHYCDR